VVPARSAISADLLRIPLLTVSRAIRRLCAEL